MTASPGIPLVTISDADLVELAARVVGDPGFAEVSLPRAKFDAMVSELLSAREALRLAHEWRYSTINKRVHAEAFWDAFVAYSVEFGR